MLKELLQKLAASSEKEDKRPLSSMFSTDAEPMEKEDMEENDPKVTIMKAKGFLKAPKLAELLGLGGEDEEEDEIPDNITHEALLGAEEKEDEKLNKILSMLGSK